MTIREKITQHSDRLQDTGTLTPHEAANILVELSALGSSLNAEIVASQADFNEHRKEVRDKHKSAVDAKIEAEAGSLWRGWQERKAQRDALVELIRSVKFYLKVAQIEYSEWNK